MTVTVIKLGGSLLHSAELPIWLETIHSLASTTNIVIVPGGGAFADKVREIQPLRNLSDKTAHQMALLGMCQFGYLLAGLSENIQLVEDIDSVAKNLNKNIPIIWLPTALINDDSEVSASWDFTSDSIALWLAINLLADRLVLVKTKYLDHDLPIEKHINNNDIDKGFKKFVDKYSADIKFMQKSQHQLLKGICL